FFFFTSYADPRDLHSFPTRRSSDLEDLLREEVFLHRAEELLRILEVLLPLEHLPEPGEALPVVGTERAGLLVAPVGRDAVLGHPDRKSTRLNSSHVAISYAVFCLKK